MGSCTEQELVVRRKALETIKMKYGGFSSEGGELAYAVFLDTEKLLEFCEIVTGKKYTNPIATL